MASSNNNTSIHNNIQPTQSWFLRIIYLLSGFILVGIAVAGMFLPLLPTTVFLLLAAWCFARSSERFYKWLHNNRFFGKYISDYRSGKGMTLRSKIMSISVLWLCIAVSALWGTENIFVRILLGLIAVGVTWHIISMRTSDKTGNQKQ